MFSRLSRFALAAALAFSWAGPLCAQPPAEPSHSCCPGGEKPAGKGMDAACCRAAGAVPAPAPAPVVPAPEAAALLPAAASSLFAATSSYCGLSAFRAVRLPDAPPGAHSGLSPPASGL